MQLKCYSPHILSTISFIENVVLTSRSPTALKLQWCLSLSHLDINADIKAPNVSCVACFSLIMRSALNISLIGARPPAPLYLRGSVIDREEKSLKSADNSRNRGRQLCRQPKQLVNANAAVVWSEQSCTVTETERDWRTGRVVHDSWWEQVEGMWCWFKTEGHRW